MNHIKSQYLFLGSVFFGIFLWVFVYAVLPVYPKEEIKNGAIVFIILNYLALISGFYIFKFNRVSTSNINYKTCSKLLVIMLIVIALCYALRWLDLFLIRELSFKTDPKTNRFFSDINYQKSNIVFIIASIIKSAYFFPFVIAMGLKPKLSNRLFVFCCLALFFPFIEAVLLGTRKPFLEVLLIVLLSLIIYSKVRISMRNLGLMFTGFLVFLIVTTALLFNRESKNKGVDYFYAGLLESRYNDLLSPKEEVKTYVYNQNNPDSKKFIYLTALHFGQYISHGFFEFNHIYNKENLNIGHGGHTFFAVPKLVNKIGLFNEIQYSKPLPREKVYLTAFGGLYFDFRWLSLLFMFLLGVLQKYIFQRSTESIIWKPLIIFFLIINVFLLIINYLRGGGIYPIVCFLFFIIIIKIFRLKLYEKGTSA